LYLGRDGLTTLLRDCLPVTLKGQRSRTVSPLNTGARARCAWRRRAGVRRRRHHISSLRLPFCLTNISQRYLSRQLGTFKRDAVSPNPELQSGVLNNSTCRAADEPPASPLEALAGGLLFSATKPLSHMMLWLYGIFPHAEHREGGTGGAPGVRPGFALTRLP